MSSPVRCSEACSALLAKAHPEVIIPEVICTPVVAITGQFFIIPMAFWTLLGEAHPELIIPGVILPVR